MLANQFCRPLTTIQLALKTFEQFGMVEVIDNILCVSNWERYQNVDRLSEIREYNRLAKQKQREKQKLLQNNVKDKSKTSQQCQDTDIDKEEDKEIDIKNIDKENKEKSKRFTPPTLEEVQAYCNERNNNINPEYFVDYYNSNGWIVGKAKMKDWKATVRNWERRENEKNSGHQPKKNTDQAQTGNIFLKMLKDGE